MCTEHEFSSSLHVLYRYLRILIVACKKSHKIAASVDTSLFITLIV